MSIVHCNPPWWVQCEPVSVCVALYSWLCLYLCTYSMQQWALEGQGYVVTPTIEPTHYINGKTMPQLQLGSLHTLQTDNATLVDTLGLHLLHPHTKNAALVDILGPHTKNATLVDTPGLHLLHPHTILNATNWSHACAHHLRSLNV